MATLLDDLRELADETRGIAETDIPIRTTQVTVRRRVWDTAIGTGSYRDFDLVMPQRYPVRNMTSKEISASGGRYSTEDLKWGPITPSFEGGGGYALADICPRAEPGLEHRTQIFYLLTGAVTGEYKLDSFSSTRPFRYMVVLLRSRRTP